MRVSDVARRSRRLAVVAAGLAAALGLALPAAAARATTAGYTPSPDEWWMANWHVPQQVWPLSEGADVTVGVVDTGVQASIPDLRGVVLRGADTLGDSGNGDRDFVPSQDGHGTGVAALIAGQGADGGPVGIAPRAKILPVHAADSNGSVQSVAAGIKYATQHGAKVINVSLAATEGSTPTSCDATLQDALAYAFSRNVVVVAASGDINRQGPGPIEPASCAGVLAVGGIEPNGSLWPDSTRQPYVSIAAPGDHIFIAGMDGRTGTSGDGTSYSAPLVAGAAALIRSRYPSMPWYQVDQRIIDTAIAVKPVPNDSYGYGIMDVSRAVNASAYSVSASSPNPPYTRYLAWLKSPDGRSWAKANGVTAPSSGSSADRSGSSAGAAPSATAKSGSGGSATLIIAVVVVIVVLAGIVLALVARSRSGRGPRNPGGPGVPGGSYPANAYTQPPSTESPGQYPSGGPQRP